MYEMYVYVNFWMVNPIFMEFKMCRDFHRVSILAKYMINRLLSTRAQRLFFNVNYTPGDLQGYWSLNILTLKRKGSTLLA